MSNLLTVSQAAQRLQVSESFLNKLRCLSTDGPPFIKIGAAVRYRPEDIDSWVAKQAAATTGQRPGEAS